MSFKMIPFIKVNWLDPASAYLEHVWGQLHWGWWEYERVEYAQGWGLRGVFTSLEKLSEGVDGEIKNGEAHCYILHKYSIQVLYCWWYRHVILSPESRLNISSVTVYCVYSCVPNKWWLVCIIVPAKNSRFPINHTLGMLSLLVALGCFIHSLQWAPTWV